MKKIRIFLALTTLSLMNSTCVLFTPSPHKMLSRSLKANTSYDVAIVPGIQFVEPAWDRVMQLRLIWVKHLYEQGKIKYIITSGSSVYTPYEECKIMAAYLVAMGIPEDHIFLEARAEHSTENLWYGYKLAKKHGFKTIAFCSDPVQSKLLYRFAKKRLKKEVHFMPALFDSARALPQDTPVINYAALKVANFIPITQKYSKHERWRGTMGKNINFKEKD